MRDSVSLKKNNILVDSQIDYKDEEDDEDMDHEHINQRNQKSLEIGKMNTHTLQTTSF